MWPITLWVQYDLLLLENEVLRKLLEHNNDKDRFHNASCIVHVYHVIIYKLIQHYAHVTVQKHTVKLHSDMLWWWPLKHVGM